MAIAEANEADKDEHKTEETSSIEDEGLDDIVNEITKFDTMLKLPSGFNLDGSEPLQITMRHEMNQRKIQSFSVMNDKLHKAFIKLPAELIKHLANVMANN